MLAEPGGTKHAWIRLEIRCPVVRLPLLVVSLLVTAALFGTAPAAGPVPPEPPPRFAFAFGPRGDLPGQIAAANGIAVRRDNGYVHVADGGNRVIVFDPTGREVRRFGRNGGQSGDFNGPGDIALDEDGND